MHQLPPHVARAREPVLDRVLGHLPDELLSALALGLERHGGRLAAGRLYADPDGGGCAVGVMLRELSPGDYRQSGLAFRIRRHRHRSILTERVPFDRSLVTRLSHVEMCFDRTTATLSSDSDESGPELTSASSAADLTGRWMAEGCRRRLRERNHGRRTGFFVPPEWAHGHPWVTPAVGRVAPAVAGPVLRPTRRMTGRDGTVTSVAIARPDSHAVAPDSHAVAPDSHAVALGF